jgi:hypothetical protein
MAQNHFLDSNIIVGSELHWNTHHRVLNEYLIEVKATRHISNFVSEECIRVLGNNRRYTQIFLDACCEVENFKLWAITEEIQRVKRKLFKAQRDKLYSGLQSQEEDDKDELSLHKREAIIDSFTRGNQRLQTAIGSDALQRYALEVRQEIWDAIKRVNKSCCTAEEIEFHKHLVDDSDLKQFNREEGELAKKIDNKDDVRILLDAFFVKEAKLHEKTCFVTIDKEDIIGQKSDIEACLVGLKVKPPSEFTDQSKRFWYE